jgi:hemerythrin
MQEPTIPKQLLTGIEKIDEQHEELFRRMENMELALLSGLGESELNQLVSYLEDNITEHFRAEEDFMTRLNYPLNLLHRHVEQHNEFKTAFRQFMKKYRERGADKYLVIDFDRDIRKWREKHILKLDLDCAAFIRKNYQS